MPDYVPPSDDDEALEPFFNEPVTLTPDDLEEADSAD
jgi:hypothetical protein